MRKFNVTVNGKSYVVEVEESSVGGVSTPVATAPSAPVEQKPAPSTSGGVAITAPMPGNILNVCVQNGQKVAKGDKIVVLEAMKMENDIFATVDGTVTLSVKQGDAVETGATIATIA